MGCDGGTIPRRDELVKVKKKPETRDRDSHIIFQWKYCNLSQQLLRRPIVTCVLGRLYNKIAIIEALIHKNNLPKHIKTMKDVKELSLTCNPINKNEEEFVCPITGLEMNGKFKFCTVWSCGCVFSERGLKEIKAKICPKCQNSFEDEDLIYLNADEEECDRNIKTRKRSLKCRVKDKDKK